MKEDLDLFSTTNVDYKKLVNKFLSYKVIYIFCILAFLILAFMINHFSVPKYSNRTSIYLTENENNNLLNSSDMLMNFGMFGNQKIVDNELEVIRSFSLIRSVFNELDLNVSYFSTKSNPVTEVLLNTPLVRKIEHYKDSPVRVTIDPSIPQPVYLIFKISILNDDEFMIESSGEQIQMYNYIDDQVVSVIPSIDFREKFRFGDEVRTKYFNFRVIKTESFSPDFTQNRNLYFYLNNINNLTLGYQQSIKAESTSQNSTIISVTLKETNRAKVTDFLNALTASYLERNMEKKNRIALSTVDFIDSQISQVADSLNSAQSSLQVYRSSQGVMDLSFQGQQVYAQLSRLEDQKASFEAQKKYYESLKQYLASNNDISTLSAPAVMDMVDPILTSLVQQLITLTDERARNPNEQSIFLNDLNLRIEQTKKNLQETVNNNLNSINISLNEVNYRIRNSNAQLSEMPRTELQLRNIERRFTINDEIYTFLLQKRSEAQIAKASSMPDYEIVDPAIMATSVTVSPKSTLNYAIALFLALFLPTVIILGKDFFNNKIVETDEVEKLTEFPILGRVFHSYHRSKLIVNDHPNSSVTESFRAIRTNFQFFSEGGKKQIILITSNTSGEGKTFCSTNLASAFALNGNRTCLLEFDLRRPKIHQEFTSSNMIGISSFLIDKAILEDIILPTQIENLDFIPAGPAAPNPAELINSERTAELLDKLREMYDYIIIDSAPAGILTETHILMKYTDLNVIVARLNRTLKEGFIQTLKSIRSNGFSNLSLIINDIYMNRESYRYGYDKRYYTDDTNRSFIQKIFRRSRKVS